MGEVEGGTLRSIIPQSSGLIKATDGGGPVVSSFAGVGRELGEVALWAFQRCESSGVGVTWA